MVTEVFVPVFLCHSECLQHNKSIRKALQKHGHSLSSREEQERGLSLHEFSMLYFAPGLKKHYGKAVQDLALAKAMTTVRQNNHDHHNLPCCLIQSIPLASGETVKAALNNPLFFLLQQVSTGEDVCGGGESAAGPSEAASHSARDASASP